MGRLIVQIYEIQTPEAAELMLSLGVDHIGSVVLSGQKWKKPGLKETIHRVKSCGAKSSLIPLFNDLKTILAVIDYYQPDILHFCDVPEKPDGNQGYLADTTSCDFMVNLQKTIKKTYSQLMITRSIPIAEPGLADKVPTLELAEIFAPVSDFFLTDTLLVNGVQQNLQDQPVTGFVGITGRICDWDMAAKLVKNTKIPVILAGGIAPENVYDAIMKVRPAGVDSCTGTNMVDKNGKPVRFNKDPVKVQKMIALTRQAEQKLKYRVKM
jgi:phosphoribosylanthranilate isomerase